MTNVSIVGIDTGYTGTGLAAIELAPGGTAILTMHDEVHTQPTDRKRRLLVVDDHLRRIREILHGIERFILAARPQVVVLEAFSQARNAGAATRQAMGYAAAVAVCEQHHLPVVQFTPQEIRKRLGVPGRSGKNEVWLAAAHAATWPALWSVIGEHASDAACAALAAVLPQPVDIVRVAMTARNPGG